MCCKRDGGNRSASVRRIKNGYFLISDFQVWDETARGIKKILQPPFKLVPCQFASRLFQSLPIFRRGILKQVDRLNGGARL